MPFVQKKIGRTKGFIIVTIGLVFGLLQALLTIPSGGGLLYFVLIGGIIGGLGFLLVAFRNKLTKKVKMGAIIAAVILFMAVLLSFIQLSIMAQVQQDIQDLDESSEDINSGNWEEKKSDVLDTIRNFMTNFFLLVFLLATATALMAIAVAIPPLMGREKKRFLMLIPLVVAVLAIIVAAQMTLYSLDQFGGYVDDFESADTQREYENVAEDLEEDFDVMDLIRGSQNGGILNFIAILMAIIFSFIVKVEIGDTTAPMPYPPTKVATSFNCPHCGKPFTAQQTGQVQQVGCPSCRAQVTIPPLQQPQPQQPPQQVPQQSPQQPTPPPPQPSPIQTQPVPPPKPPETEEESAMDILKKRLAKGEIDIETYRKLKKEIE